MEYVKPALVGEVEFDAPDLTTVPLPLTSNPPAVVLRNGNVVFVVDSKYMSPAGIFIHLLMDSS